MAISIQYFCAEEIPDQTKILGSKRKFSFAYGMAGPLSSSFITIGLPLQDQNFSEPCCIGMHPLKNSWQSAPGRHNRTMVSDGLMTDQRNQPGFYKV
jgi:hypothetical protein